jgi:hypothetical protein
MHTVIAAASARKKRKSPSFFNCTQSKTYHQIVEVCEIGIINFVYTIIFTVCAPNRVFTE